MKEVVGVDHADASDRAVVLIGIGLRETETKAVLPSNVGEGRYLMSEV
jgi:hypothetical protein